MKEYKIIKQKMIWTKSQEKFEIELKNFAKQGWRVVNIYVISNHFINALLERDKIDSMKF